MSRSHSNASLAACRETILRLHMFILLQSRYFLGTPGVSLPVLQFQKFKTQVPLLAELQSTGREFLNNAAYTGKLRASDCWTKINMISHSAVVILEMPNNPVGLFCRLRYALQTQGRIQPCPAGGCWRFVAFLSRTGRTFTYNTKNGRDANVLI